MKQFICEKCKLEGNIKNFFNDQMSFDMHKWEYHPNGSIEIYWSELKKNGKLYNGNYTLGYQNDPYY